MALTRQYIVGSQPYSDYVNETTNTQFIISNVFIDGTSSSTSQGQAVSGMISAIAPAIRYNVKVIGY